MSSLPTCVGGILFLTAVAGIRDALPAPGDPVDSLLQWVRVAPRGSSLYAGVCRRLANYSLTNPSTLSRRRAESLLRQALQDRPHDAALHVALMRVLLARGSYLAARDHADFILSLGDTRTIYDSERAEAYYVKGLIAERDALKYETMIALVPSGGARQNVLSLEQFGADALRLAAACFESALTLDSGHRDARLHLAQLYMERETYEPMAALMEQALAADTRDKEACMGAAYACFQLGRFEASQAYYDRALDLMAQDERTAYTSLDYLQSTMAHSGSSGTPVPADSSRSYWYAKDPLFLTAINEATLEHYSRITYANFRYGTEKMPGWKTERGQWYIRYGRPDLAYTLQPDMGLLGGAQVWNYGEATLRFEDAFASGKFIMDNRSVLEAESYAHTSAARYALPSRLTFPIQARFYQFKGAQGTEIEAYASTACSEWPVRAAGITGGLYLMDATGAPVIVTRTDLTASDVKRVDKAMLAHLHAVWTGGTSEDSEYSLELLTADNHAAVNRGLLRLRSFDGERLCLSDVVAASALTDRAESRPVFSPLFDERVSRKKGVYLYFETYNLSLDNTGQAQYEVEVAFQQEHGWLRSLFSNATRIVSFSSLSEASHRQDAVHLALDLRALQAGAYQVQIRVSDLVSHTSAVATLPLVVTE